jgi:DUF4097 and DUF4098 domain-containing protein YvlB
MKADRRTGGLAVTAALLAAAMAASPADRLAAQDFSWKGRVASGKRLEVKGVNGDIQASLASGNEIEVTARKHARRSDPEEVEIRVVEHDDGVTICAVYPTPRRAKRENDCGPGDHWHSSTENNDVSVDFTVRVPAGVVAALQTVNGEVEGEGLKGDVEASTVNGSVSVSTTGFAEAQTVNGSIRASMGRADFRHAEFSTVNGGITLDMPADLSVEIRAETLNGDIESDFPMTIEGRRRYSPRRIVGTIGTNQGSGRTLYLKTVNGSLRLRKLGSAAR